jgi:hypothetical protein
MAEYPKIDSPCPIKWTSLPEAGNNFCKLCERSVHNLSAMTQTERKAFMASCTGSVCVAYAAKPGREQKIVWAMAMAATVAIAPGIASAQSDAVEALEMEVFVGGVKEPGSVQWQDDEKPQQLPVIMDPDFKEEDGKQVS